MATGWIIFAFAMFMCHQQALAESTSVEFAKMAGQVGTGTVIDTVTVTSLSQCGATCRRTASCVGFNAEPSGDGFQCELLDSNNTGGATNGKVVYISQE